ncbi:hypothetical protein ACFY4F_16705 [Peribacillus butanolivorans]|uniref:hypothetical protein n=1 Tax=Peribacillus butanolivorans TaxID=421767 RepID=UPI0036CBBBD7
MLIPPLAGLVELPGDSLIIGYLLHGIYNHTFFEINVLTCPSRVYKYCKTFSPKEMMCTMSTIRSQWNKENDAAVFSPGDQR